MGPTLPQTPHVVVKGISRQGVGQGAFWSLKESICPYVYAAMVPVGIFWKFGELMSNLN
jgi:hypothetical protein